jgi:hypothetical protein
MGILSAITGPTPGDWRKEFAKLKQDFDRLGGKLGSLRKDNASEFAIVNETTNVLFKSGANLLKKNPGMAASDKISIITGLEFLSTKMKEMGVTN